VSTRQRGSHHLFSRPGFLKLVNLQDDNGSAKSYQIRQLLRMIEEISELNAADDEEPTNA
jgi:hypothetical protein